MTNDMREKFEKPVEAKDLHIGCICCSTAATVAPMDMIIAVGFGAAFVMKDDKCIYSEDRVEDDKYWTVQDAENLAVLEPDCNWRITKEGPLHGETFQRQGVGNWVCIESNQGFA